MPLQGNKLGTVQRTDPKEHTYEAVYFFALEETKCCVSSVFFPSLHTHRDGIHIHYSVASFANVVPAFFPLAVLWVAGSLVYVNEFASIETFASMKSRFRWIFRPYFAKNRVRDASVDAVFIAVKVDLLEVRGGCGSERDIPWY